MAGDENVGIAELLRRAIGDGSRLIQQEIGLAKQELSESLRAVLAAAIAGVIVILAVLGFFVMAIVTIVVAVGTHWLAALGFTALFLVIALGSAWFAFTRVRRVSPLTKTRETIQEDIQWAKQQLKPGAR